MVPLRRTQAQSAGADKTAAPARTDTFHSMLTEAEKAEQAAKAPPLADFSKMTDKQKISALATLHDATDYSGMTDAEKYKLMNDRFEAAFPALGAYESGLIGRDSVHYFGTDQFARPVTGTAALIQKEQSRQWASQGLEDISALHREAYYPGMSDGETAKAVRDRLGGGNFAAQANVLQELKTLGLGDSNKIGETLSEMRCKLVQWAKSSRTPTGEDADNAAQEDMVLALATGGRVRSGGGTDWGALKRALSENAGAWDQKIADGYGKQVQKVIDELIDGIVKGGEAQKGGEKTEGKAQAAAAEE